MLPGIVGVIQANEALKILVGYGEPLTGRLLMFDAMQTSFRTLKLRRDPECATCGKNAEAWQVWEAGTSGAPSEAVAVRMDSLPVAAAAPAGAAAVPPEAGSANAAATNGTEVPGADVSAAEGTGAEPNGAHANGAKAKHGKGKHKAEKPPARSSA